MKKVMFLTILIIIFSFSVSHAKGYGSSFGAMTTAGNNGANVSKFIAGVGLADNNCFFGVFSYGMSDHVDGRLKIGLIDDKFDNTEISFGADFKYNIVSVSELNNGPFDMAIGAFFEYYDFNLGSVWQFGGQYIGSYPIVMSDSSHLIPYGRLNVRVESFSSDLVDNSDIEVGINAGVKWEATKSISLYGEFQLDGNDGFFLGSEFNF